MNTAHQPVSRLAWLWLVAALALAVAPHLLRTPAWIALLCIGAIGWRLLRDLYGWPLPKGWLRAGLTLVALAAVAMHFGTVAGRDAGAALLAVMLSLKLTEMRTFRDAALVIVLAYFLLATNFLFNQSIFTGAYLFFTVLMLTAALIALNHPAAERKMAKGYLLRSMRLMVEAVPLMVVLFLLFPRLQGAVWGLPTQDLSSHTGLSEEMSVGDISRLADSDEVAFRVEFEGSVPPASSLYWRGPVLWHTDGRRWRPLNRAEHMMAPPPVFDPQGAEINYQVTVEPHSKQWLFALDLPTQVAEKSILTSDFQLLSMDKVDSLRRYSMRSATAYRTRGLSPEQRKAALALPEGAHPRSRQVAKEWGKTGSAEAVVAAGLRHFRDQPFYYSRKPPILGGDPIDEFLFDTRRGFCEHYAAAYVVLMRAAGVPARVVTGYQGGDLNPVGKYLLVRQSDAHAWAEVFLEGTGWTRVDPTAAIPLNRIELHDRDRFSDVTPRVSASTGFTWLRRTWLQAQLGWDAVNHGWNQWVLGYGADQQRHLLQRLGLSETSWLTLGAWLVGSVLVLTVIAALALWPGRRQVDPLVREYERLLQRLARRGFHKQPAEGPLDLAARVAVERPHWTPALTPLLQHYAALRYGPTPPPESVLRFRQNARDFKP